MTTSPSDADQEALAQARARIDEIDGRILALYAERALMTEQVRRSKGPMEGLAYRPAREAQMCRRLFAEPPSAPPLKALYAAWREILAASIMAQTPFELVLAAPFQREPAELIAAAARLHFGAMPKIVSHEGARGMLRALRGPAGLRRMGLAPGGFDQEEPRPWWREILAAAMSGQRPAPMMVVAALPLITPDGDPWAFALADARLEPSGDDRTLIALCLPTPLSRSAAASRAQDAGATLRAACPDAVLLEAEGFRVAEDLLAPDAELCERLLTAYAAAPRDVALIGVYAPPLAHAAF